MGGFEPGVTSDLDQSLEMKTPESLEVSGMLFLPTVKLCLKFKFEFKSNMFKLSVFETQSLLATEGNFDS